MHCDLQLAAAADVADLLSIRTAVNHRRTENGILFAMRNSSVFANSERPLYLTSMAVHPDVQRCGIGRLCVEEARRIALDWSCDAIRLDAYDAVAGTGEFYRKRGFREVYHELLL